MGEKEKYENLKTILKEMGQVIVAYSGGVDSSFLLKVAYDVLREKAMGVLAVSASFPSREYKRALDLAKRIGVHVEVIHTHEIEDPRYVENPVNRCYFCKKELFGEIEDLAKKGEFKNLVDGSNFDDMGDHRPGMKALKEKKVRSPLLEAELTKIEIRNLSRELGLPTWEKDELACLSSRFPYGEKITEKKLQMVDRAENFLSDLGFHNIRARHTGNTLKIEVSPEDINRFFDPALREKVIRGGKKIGYTYVTVDLEGYRRGSMNEGKK